MANKENKKQTKKENNSKIKEDNIRVTKKQTKNNKVNNHKIKNNKVKDKKVNKEAIEAEKQINKLGSSSEIIKLIKIVLIVTAVMLVFYLITLVATGQADKVNKQNEEDQSTDTATEIQYDYIVIGTMLNKDGNYYVLIEADEDNRLSEYSTLIQTISADEDAPKIYHANLTDSFNKNYLAKEAKYDVQNISDFRVTGTALVEINNHEIAEVFDTYDEIKGELNELAE